MTITTGSRLGPYEIISPLGAGGMGEVWRARDTRLERSVAIKVLPPSLAGNEQFRARFEREAKAISQLNHPHICTLHDVGHENGVSYLVMELLEGESLADRLVRGPLLLSEVLKYGMQIASALDRAHRGGIVHRDLKPGNVVVTKSGAKLLDFGLAKTSPPILVSEDGATEHRPLTQEGSILGTFQYMAPEQLEGVEADPRTDIFALGALLYEMATGRRAFEGKTRTSLIAAIVSGEPPRISALQPLTPPALEHVIARCLAKDPDDRWQSAHDIAQELLWIGDAGSQAGVAAAVRSRKSRALTLGWGVAAVTVLLAAMLAALLFRATARLRAEEHRVLRTQFVPRKGERLAFNLRAFAISPDGSRLVYCVQNGVTTLLRVRSLDSDESKVIPGTEGASHPFFSPDGKWIAFTAGPKIKKVALAGGTPVTLCNAPFFRGASWSEDGSMYVVPNVYGPVFRIPPNGGRLEAVTKIRTKDGEQQHRWPEILPGGKVILYTIGSGADWDEATIVAERIGTGERTVLVKGGTSPRYLSTGHLVYSRAGALYAVSFDPRSLKVDGAPVEVAHNVLVDPTGDAQMDFSRNGILVTAPSDGSLGDQMLSWIDRDGRGEPLKLDHQPYLSVVLSPDGSRVVLGIGNSIAVLDLGRLSTRKLTLPARAESAIWSPDGRRLYFGLEKDNFFQIFSKAADDSGIPQLVFPSDSAEDPAAIFAAGSQLLSLRNPSDGRNELVLHQMGGAPSPPAAKVLFKSLFLDVIGARISPDGRWVVYQSEESCRPEIYVRPTSGEDKKWQVSTDGGASPVWSPADNEIFYTCGTKFMAASASAGQDEFVPGTPKVLFDNHEVFAFDVTRDGKRFLTIEDPSPGAQAGLDVTVNWFADVSGKVREAKAP